MIVDNNSSYDTVDYLSAAANISVWQTGHSYKASQFGVDWLNELQARYGRQHWTLVVDPDEFLIYPFCDSRRLPALND